MSSAPAIVPTAAPSSSSSSSTAYWCDACGMSAILSPNPNPLHCPRCRSLFIHHDLDSSHPHHQRTRHALALPFSSSSSASDSDDPDPFPNPNPNPSRTAYLHHLLIHQLAAGDDDPSSDLFDHPSPGPTPASKPTIDSIPTVEISDPSLLCAICKDEFPLRSSARKLPCSHVYHSDCIVPWLNIHNSCPLCRFRLPEVPNPGAAPAVEGVRLSEWIHRERTTRRRRQLGFAQRGEVLRVTATQMAEELVGGEGGPANSWETVSSEWTMEGGDSAVSRGFGRR